jgi:hypothetical protein
VICYKNTKLDYQLVTPKQLYYLLPSKKSNIQRHTKNKQQAPTKYTAHANPL